MYSIILPGYSEWPASGSAEAKALRTWPGSASLSTLNFADLRFFAERLLQICLSQAHFSPMACDHCRARVMDLVTVSVGILERPQFGSHVQP